MLIYKEKPKKKSISQDFAEEEKTMQNQTHNLKDTFLNMGYDVEIKAQCVINFKQKDLPSSFVK